MTSGELAAMTFESLVKGDNSAAKNMALSVPQYTYRSTDKEYVACLNHIFDVAAQWSIEYWKCYCKMLACAEIKNQSQKPDSQDERQAAEELERIWEGRLCALGQILISLSDNRHVDIESMVRFSDAKCVYGLDIPVANLSDDAREYYENYTNHFQSLIDGTTPPKSVANYFGWNN